VSHIENVNNPHEVTAEQIGIIAIPNDEIDTICGVTIVSGEEVQL
jgi:hypothetical protein